jgi:hypothetical protein
MKALENNWKQKSIENLEKDFWGQPPKGSTTMIDRVYRLRTIQIERLEPKDLRLLIGQEVGLRFLIPVALKILRNNLFVDSEFYEGDLLQNVIKVDSSFWDTNKELKKQFDDLLKPYSEEDIEKFRQGKFNEWT